MEKKRGYFVRVVSILFLVMLFGFTAGCGKEASEDLPGNHAEIPEANCYRKVSREVSFSGYSVYANEIQLLNNDCCFVHMENLQDEEENWNAGRSLVRMNLETGETETIAFYRNMTVNAFCLNSFPGQEDSITAVAHDFEDYAYTLYEYGLDGKPVKEIELADAYFGYWIRKLPDGSYLSGDSTNLCFVGADGSCEKAGADFLKGQIGSCIVTGEGKVYVTYHDSLGEEASAVRIDVRNRTLEEVGKIPGRGEILTCYGEKDFLCMDRKGIYRFDTEKKEAECLIDLTLISGIVMDRIRGIQWYEDQVRGVSWNYWKAGENAEIFSFERMTAEEVMEREKIRQENNFDDQGRQYVTLYGKEKIFNLMLGQNMVNDFNLQSQEYHVIFKEMEETDGILVSEDCPDLMYLFLPTDVEDYYQAGVLENLMPYMKRSSVLYPENVQDYIYKAYGFDGGLYGFTRTGTIQTFLMRESQAVGKNGWTVDDFLTLLEEHPSTLCTSPLWKEGILDTILLGNMDTYVDMEKREVFFQTPEFQKTLERIRDLKLNEKAFTYWSGVEDEDLKEIILLNEWQSNADRIAFLENIFGEKMVELGLPNDRGNSQAALNLTDAYVILKNGKCKAGAFAFLEYVMGLNRQSAFYSEEEIAEYERQGVSYGSGEMFAVKSLYDTCSKQAVGTKKVELWSDDLGSDSHSLGIVEYEITAEHERLLLDALLDAKADTLIEQTIREIVQEEAAYFFDRQKPVESVCNIIQNRVKLLLDENMQ